MKTIDKKYVEENEGEILGAIQDGAIFIYPTDTIYGLGCSAVLDESVEKIRVIKDRPDQPFSIIAPSKEWVTENCKIEIEDTNKYLPGPYTLFLNKKDSSAVSRLVNPKDETLGVRIPDHWFSEIVAKSGVPFVTTSVNVHGDEYMKKIEDVSEWILGKVDFIIYEGEIDREPSIKVDLTNKFD